jgi:hypothetical protein
MTMDPPTARHLRDRVARDTQFLGLFRCEHAVLLECELMDLVVRVSPG